MTVSALVLAGGMSTRMGPTNKLLVDLDGEPMVRQVVKVAVDSHVDLVTVVTGYQADEVTARVNDLACKIVHNPAYAEGLASTLGAGLASLPQTVEATVVVLGDMPKVSSQHINRLVETYASATTTDIVVPTYKGRFGNPVLFARRYFAQLMALTGDIGGRRLLRQYRERVCEIPMDDDAVLLDVDRPCELVSLQP